MIVLLTVLLAATGSAAGSTSPASLAAVAAPLGLSAAQMDTLDAGEVVVAKLPSPGDDSPGLAYRVLAAPADRVFRAVVDWAHYDEFFPFVVSSQVRNLVPKVTLSLAWVKQEVDLPFPIPDRRFVILAMWDHPTHGAAPSKPFTARWNYLDGSGNIESQEGRWRLWSLDAGRTLVELRLASDAGPGVPDRLEAKALADTLPWALDGLRQQVDRCRYDLPIHPTCREAPPTPAGEAQP